MRDHYYRLAIQGAHNITASGPTADSLAEAEAIAARVNPGRIARGRLPYTHACALSSRTHRKLYSTFLDGSASEEELRTEALER